jgi:hypothetical protein
MIALIDNLICAILSMMMKQRQIMNGTGNKREYTNQQNFNTRTLLFEQKLLPN